MRHAPFNHLCHLTRVLFSTLLPSSTLLLHLYAERFARRDVIIGMHEMILPVESQTSSFSNQKPLIFDQLKISRLDVPFTLTNGDRQVRYSDQPVTLYLTVVLSPNTTPCTVLPVNTTNLQSTEVNVSTPREATSSMAQDSANATRSTVAADSEALSPPTDRLPGTAIPPAADRRAGIPPLLDTLDDTEKAMTSISNLSDTWESALERIKWVMDTVSPVAGVRRNFLSTDP